MTDPPNKQPVTFEAVEGVDLKSEVTQQWPLAAPPKERPLEKSPTDEEWHKANYYDIDRSKLALCLSIIAVLLSGLALVVLLVAPGAVSREGPAGPAGRPGASIVGPKGDTGEQGIPGPPGAPGETVVVPETTTTTIPFPGPLSSVP